MKNICHTNSNHKKASVSVLISKSTFHYKDLNKGQRRTFSNNQ